MKLFLLLLISLPAFADVKTCREFVQTVLTPAVTESDEGYRFIQDEEAALKFIRSYNVSKLQIKEEIKLAEVEMEDCKFFNDPKKNELYCGGLFENYHYLQGLQYAVENYKWKEATRELAKSNLKAFLNEATAPGAPLLYIAMSYTLLGADQTELNKSIEKLRADAKKNPQKTCEDFQRTMKAERKEAAKFREKLVKLIKDMK